MKKEKVLKVIFIAINLILTINFFIMMYGYEYPIVVKTILWIWFIIFIINFIKKFIIQIKQLKLMKICDSKFELLQYFTDFVATSSPNLDENSITKLLAILKELYEYNIDFYNLILNQNILKEYNKEHLNKLIERSSLLVEPYLSK